MEETGLELLILRLPTLGVRNIPRLNSLFAEETPSFCCCVVVQGSAPGSGTNWPSVLRLSNKLAQLRENRATPPQLGTGRAAPGNCELESLQKALELGLQAVTTVLSRFLFLISPPIASAPQRILS